MSTFLLAALRRISARILLLQLSGNALLMLLGLAWLNIPDSHSWQLILSALTGALLIAALLALYTHTLRDLREAIDPAPLWLEMLLLPAWILVYRIFAMLAARLNERAMERAGYWNSQLSPHLRTVFTFDRLLHWQNNLVQVLIWVILPCLILPLLVETCVRGFAGWRNGLRELRRWQNWITVAAASWAGCALTSLLLGWLPGHGVRGELISVVLRVTVVYLLDVLLMLVVLAIASELLSRNDITRNSVS